jgi:predicted nucleic acid-binding Zn ribbon protein
MYCSACGGPVTPGLKFCNRCGTILSKEPDEKKEIGVAPYLISAVTVVALGGLGIMFGGAIALKNGGGLTDGAVALFMLLAFALVGTVEVFLLRQLSRQLETGGRIRQNDQPQPLFQPSSISPHEVGRAPRRAFPEAVPSVTEHTTRTLQQSAKES